MKKEYYLPLAIIIGTIIIGLSIYLGSTAEYRAKKAQCEKEYGHFRTDVIKKMLMEACIKDYK